MIKKIEPISKYESNHPDQQAVLKYTNPLLKKAISAIGNQDNDPTGIYHYTSPHGLKSILEDKALYFTDIDFLNDYSEDIYINNVIEKILSDINQKQILDLNKWFLYSLQVCYVDSKYYDPDRYPKKYYRYISSFSMSKDNLSLWNYYTKTNNKIGYNIEFSTKKIIDSLTTANNNVELLPGKVIYESTQQEEIILNLIKDFNSLYTNRDIKINDLIFPEFNNCIEILSPFFKHKAFENENEFRIVLTEKVSPNGIENIKRNAEYRESNGSFIPFIIGRFDKKSVTKIGISPVKEEKLTVSGIENMLLDLDYDINIHTSEIPFRG